MNDNALQKTLVLISFLICSIIPNHGETITVTGKVINTNNPFFGVKLEGIVADPNGPIRVSSGLNTYESTGSGFSSIGVSPGNVNDTAWFDSMQDLFAVANGTAKIDLTTGSFSTYNGENPWGAGTAQTGNFSAIGSGNFIYMLENTTSGPVQAGQFALPGQLSTDLGGTYTGLDLALADGGDPSNPNHYYAAVTGDNNAYSIFSMTASPDDYMNFALSNAVGTNQDIALRDGKAFITNYEGFSNSIYEVDMSSYTPQIPEPSVGLLAGLAAAAMVARRKRE